MKALRRSARRGVQCLIVTALVVAGGTVSGGFSGPDRWTRVEISDAITRYAVQWSLEAADEWLKSPGCETMFSEFHDRQGRPLTAALSAFGVSGREYLNRILFVDGSAFEMCHFENTLAFTTPGSRVVLVCGRTFARKWETDQTTATAIVLHETLHSLGLGENPPSSTSITLRVQLLCGNR